MKNVYLVQPTFMNDSSIHFPYAIGALASYAWNDEEVSEHYNLDKIFFLRDEISSVVNSLLRPFIVGFSNYIWNFEYNKKLAESIKKKYPDCTVIFGGPQISEDGNILEKYHFIDILIFNEGEIPFKNILKTYINDGDLSCVNNISFRGKEGKIITTNFEVYKVEDFPSPFESGFYERLIKESPDIDFIPLIETNRGCPNKCAYCSWGKIKSSVRLFPIERVFRDIEWVSNHKMEFLGLADANFGLFPRDETIADKIIECYHETGYPKKFQVSYSKDTGDRVFNITKKLNENGMDKGVTLSFQSMSKVVQENIGRSNMDVEYYKELLNKYSVENIPTYTDLILGLPGESYQSFKDGIDELLELGQHTSLFVHLCEWLPLAEMSKKEYIDKYKLGFTKIPLNQPHRSAALETDVQEYSRIVTSSYSMTEKDWENTVMFATCTLALHYLGLLQLVALYLRFEKNIVYSDFYSDILDYMLTDTDVNDVFKKIKHKVEQVTRNQGAVVIFDKKFGDVAWPFEEYAFLRIVSEKDTFYKSIKKFLSKYIYEESILDDLLSYQNFVIKTINCNVSSKAFLYNWKQYFEAILVYHKHIPLKREAVRYTIKDINTTYSWDEYAKNVLWFGRRGGKNIYTTEIQEEKRYE